MLSVLQMCIRDRFSDLHLTPIDAVDPDSIIITASMVGAPAAKEKYVSPADLRCV